MVRRRGKINDVNAESLTSLLQQGKLRPGKNWTRVETTVIMHSGCKFNMAAVRGLTWDKTHHFLRGCCVLTSRIPGNARGISQEKMHVLTSEHGLFRKVRFSSCKFASSIVLL